MPVIKRLLSCWIECNNSRFYYLLGVTVEKVPSCVIIRGGFCWFLYEQFQIRVSEAAWRSFRAWSFQDKALVTKSGVSRVQILSLLHCSEGSTNANVGCVHTYLFQFVMGIFMRYRLTCGLIDVCHSDADGVLSVRTTGKLHFSPSNCDFPNFRCDERDCLQYWSNW